MFIVQPVTEHLFHWTSTDINTKIKLKLVQNYGWPTGPAKIWLWLARRPFATGKHNPSSQSSKVRDLGVIFYPFLNFDKYICGTCL